MTRKTPYQKSQGKIIKLYLAEEELRKICIHPREYVQSFGRTTGTTVFSEHKCHWCGKIWSEKQ